MAGSYRIPVFSGRVRFPHNDERSGRPIGRAGRVQFGTRGATFALGITGLLLLEGVPSSASVAEGPPSVTTGAVTAVTPTSVTVSGAVNPNGLATTWVVQYGLGANTTYASTTPTEQLVAGKATVNITASLSGLSPSTSYRYRVVATSSAGTTDGANGVFNTSAAPAVITNAADNVTASGAVLNGSVNPEGLATTWYFEYGTSTGYGSKTPSKQIAASPNPSDVNSSVTDLASHSTYHFRLVAISSAGKSYGSDFTLTTDLSVSINAPSSPLTYGGFIQLSGTVASRESGVQVTIMSQPYAATSFSGIAQVTTGSGGYWQYSAQPTILTTYEAYANNGTSSPVVVSVSPDVFLTINRSGSLTTHVVGATSFAGHVLQLQRLSHGLWVTWKHVLLEAGGRATFATSLPTGRTQIRMAIGPFVPGVNQAGPGYLAGYSKVQSYYQKS